MAASGNLVDQLYRSLDEVPPDEMMPVIRAALAEAIHATDVVLVLADYAELTLERFDYGNEAAPTESRSSSIDSTVPGGCYKSQEVVVEHLGHLPAAWTICAPVTVRSERYGVLEVELAAEPSLDAQTAVVQVACALAYVIASARRYTDVFERVRRRRHLALPAEMQWELLPVLGYDSPPFSLAGSLEPAYDIGGDSFDYAVDGDLLTLSISDAMGHGLRASLCATLAVTAMRNARRAGGHILEQVNVASRVVGEQFGGDTFITTLIMEIDTTTGRGTAINAGHPPAWRHGSTSVGVLELPPDPPLGMVPGGSFHLHPVRLLPGDRLVLLTDGILDAGPSRADPFGMERFSALVADRRTTPPREFVRQVTRAVLAHRGDGQLLDDATLLCLDWTGPSDAEADA